MRAMALAICVGLAAFSSSAQAYAPQSGNGQTYMATRAGLHNATLLIVRHGEKDGLGAGLSAAGTMRAVQYARYFQTFKLDGKPLQIDALVASEDSRKSERPRLTLEPFSQTSKLVIYQPSPSHEVRDLVSWLKQRPAGQNVLISWHHTKIPALLAALKLPPATLLPKGKWPNDAFDWVLVLRFDDKGHPIARASHLITEPDRVNDPVWSTMGHPVISPLGAVKQ
ncbi:hypothetical protein [Acidisoma silvae]|uniref:Flagellar basal body-associated protein FliL n=1 Tax=Acidisoma silvae TaxID=2802396 RepID=A0A964DZS0_9PROT|nr:hypothetical protein [Acidisoma silvae]MCB8875943.1 hypothetical protein [Acidisoma silvae]